MAIRIMASLWNVEGLFRDMEGYMGVKYSEPFRGYSLRSMLTPPILEIAASITKSPVN